MTDMPKKPPECQMCDKRPMTPILKSDGSPSSFLGCANCDSPKGHMPTTVEP